MVLNVHRNHKAYYRREAGGWGGGGGWGTWNWGKRYMIKPSLNCHHQNDSRIRIDSDESHFNVTLIMTDKVTRQTTTFEEKGETEADSNRGLSAYQPNALPLGPTGSHRLEHFHSALFIARIHVCTV